MALRGVDPPASRIVELEVGRPGRIAEKACVGWSGKRVFLRQPDQLDRVRNEALDARLGQIARRRRRHAPRLHDTQSGGARPGLLHELGLSFAHFGRQLGTRAEHALGDQVGASPLAACAQNLVSKL